MDNNNGRDQRQGDGEIFIDFNHVSNDVKGCGFRHEEFPNIHIDDVDRINYISYTRQRNYLQNILHDIPDNLPSRTLDAFIKGIISLKMETSLNMDTWWENANRKYGLPKFAKYNPQMNMIFRHITENGQVTSLDRNPNYNPNNNQNGNQNNNNGNGNNNNNWEGNRRN
jgi:hypothetical protein